MSCRYIYPFYWYSIMDISIKSTNYICLTQILRILLIRFIRILNITLTLYDFLR